MTTAARQTVDDIRPMRVLVPTEVSVPSESMIDLAAQESEAKFTVVEPGEPAAAEPSLTQNAFSVLVTELAAIGAVFVPGLPLSASSPLLTVVEGVRVSAIKGDIPGVLASIGVKSLKPKPDVSSFDDFARSQDNGHDISYEAASQKYRDAVSLGYHLHA